MMLELVPSTLSFSAKAPSAQHAARQGSLVAIFGQFARETGTDAAGCTGNESKGAITALHDKKPVRSNRA